MPTHQLRLLCVVLLSILFSTLFWEEKMGVNVLIFSTLSISLLLMVRPLALRSKPAMLCALAAIGTGALIVVYNSGTAKFVHICAMILFVGFAHQPRIKTILYSLAGLLYGWGVMIYEFHQKLPSWKVVFPWLERRYLALRISLIPVGIILPDLQICQPQV